MIKPNHPHWETWLQKWFLPLLIPAILVNAGGLLIPILEPDGSLYATIAKTIAQSGDFIQLKVEGKDWLDKPHFPFWMAALSFRLLGINAFAYKFPALLFWGLGAWYTWKFALSLYGKPVAQLATLIYMSAAHLVISNNDVRAEPYLTGLIIGSVYHFYRAARARPGLHLLAGSLLAGCACMTKGPFVLITIGAGFILDWISGREWEQFRHPRWWIAILLTAVFTLPEIYCLYVQFDLHPEKIVFGRTGVSGVRFFFWDSQFGRFFNTGPIKGSGDPFFYFHTVLWAFLPWSLLLYAAIVQKCRRRRAFPGDLICLGAALASFIVFSLSRFQLPHYLNILFPFFAILTAAWLHGVTRRGTLKTIRVVQNSIAVLLPILLLALCWFFHFDGWVLIIIAILALGALPFVLFREMELFAPIVRSFWMALLVFSFVNFILYPAILQYQAGTVAGRYYQSDELKAAPVFLLNEAPVNYSFEFDCPAPVERIPIDSIPAVLRREAAATVNGHPRGYFQIPTASGRPSALVFAPAAFADTLARRGYQATPLHSFPNFHISQLTGKFIDYRTRLSVTTPWSLMRVAAK